jgi:uncharacterized protein
MLTQLVTPDSCLNCGACCAHFRVSFYWAEGLNLPEHYTEPVNAVYSCMSGTNQAQPRCIALEGEIGQQVGCSVYAARSSSCQQVQAGDSQCNKARAAYNLIPLLQIEVSDANNDDDFDRVS